MPAVSKLQAAYMRACLDPKFRKKAKKKCPPEKIAREFAHMKKKGK